MSTFNEKDHPRGKAGKFTEKTTGRDQVPASAPTTASSDQPVEQAVSLAQVATALKTYPDTVDVGAQCVYCGASTLMGTGNFVNRLSANAYGSDLDERGILDKFDAHIGPNTLVEGYMCPSCQVEGTDPCDRCLKTIDLDEDITTARGDRVHRRCLTHEELHDYLYDLGYAEDEFFAECERCNGSWDPDEFDEEWQ